MMIYLYMNPSVYIFSDERLLCRFFIGYMFAGDVIAAMEKQSKDLANSVMKRAEAVYNRANTKVCVLFYFIF